MSHRLPFSFAAVAAVTLFAVPAAAQRTAAPAKNPAMSSQKPCASVTGTARTACLNAEVARTKREAQLANRKVQRLETAIKVACGADVAVGAAVGATGRVVGGVAGGVAARGAYGAGKAAGNAATRQQAPCTKRAQ